MTQLVDYNFGPSARLRLDEAAKPDHDGALAALESFYYALNHKDLDSLAAVWSQDELAQLNNPVGGILRSGKAVTDLYRRIFAGHLDLQVTFTDAATYRWADGAVFAGRELGTYRNRDGDVVPLTIRTSRVFRYEPDPGRWLQIHHHGSIDQPAELAAYQAAVQPPPA
ncbi:YybH family protein [Kribbella shirazensis]|uniref:Ketosteroid isomerase-like protein n=1 Tax=Kribbella shirazensis TaxID=1105143 RepID=A0A7X6A4J4_9ACTN|nr:nuclear transport factor 2 family protein [Kribbella shirazensis]NIK61521.1 ketosteroid isomerase-like protein [Kribbella shirazensis]